MEKRDFKPDIRYYYSEINNRLKVVEREGKKLLDTKDTNYSFGGLQKVLEFGLDLVPLAEFESVLVLGMGAGSIVDSLRNNSSFFGKITGVEIDPVVIEIAENEFDLFADKNLQVVQQDASAYVKEADQLFDLIVVDVFINLTVPPAFYQPEFWEDVEKLIRNDGFVIFNAGIDWNEKSMYEFLDTLPESFIYQKNLHVMGSNTVIIMHKVF